MANPNLYYKVIERPLVTEKSTVLQDIRNQYSFKVHKKSNKSEIKKAVEALFDVKVEAVNIINMPGKYRRVLGRPGKTQPWKKALIKLKEGHAIDIV